MLIKHLTEILLLFFLLAMGDIALADVESWLSKISRAYGGVQQIDAAQSYRQYGVTFSSMRGREGKVFRAYRHPDHLRIEIDYGQGRPESRLLAGSRTWNQNKPVQEPFYSAMLLQAGRLGLPAALLDFRKHVKDVGSYRSLNGTVLHGLELSFHRHNLLKVGIEPKSGRIVESRGVIKTKQFTMNFTTLYTDFRKVDGRLFAFKETHYVMGRKSGYTHLDRVVIGPLDDKWFYPFKTIPVQQKLIVSTEPKKS